MLGSRLPRAIWLYLGICLISGLSCSASSTTVPGLGCRSAGVQRRVFPRLSLRGGRERPAAARPRVSDVVSAERETTKVAGGKDEKAMQAMVFPVLLRGLVGLQEQDVRDLLEDCGAPVAVKFAGRASSTKRKAIVFFGDRAEARRAHKINGCVVADGAVRSSLLPPVPREEVTAVSAAVGKAGECVPRWRGSPTVECPMAVEGARACGQTWHLTGMHVPVSGCSEFSVSGFGARVLGLVSRGPSHRHGCCRYPPPGESVAGWGRNSTAEYPVVVNGVPQGITEDVLLLEGRKFGEVLRVKLDRRKQGVAWVTFAGAFMRM